MSTRIASAIVAAIAVSAVPAAFATQVEVVQVSNSWTGPDTGPEVLPSNAFVDATSVAPLSTRKLVITAAATSVYLGRSTGYNVRLTLGQGEFASSPTATGINSTVSIAGGGTGHDSVTYAVTPAATGVVEGDGIVVLQNVLRVNEVALLGAGGQIDATVQVFDPVGGNQLGPDITVSLIRSTEGWELLFVPSDENQRIDVGLPSAKRNFGSRDVGSGSDATVFVAGSTWFYPSAGLTTTHTLSPSATASVVVSGLDFSAFRDLASGAQGSIFLSASSTCSTAGVPLQVAADGFSAETDSNYSQINTYRYVCFDANGESTIAPQPVSASVVVSQSGHLDSAPLGRDLLAMEYNGPVVEIASFNPASNADQQSYLRVVNPSVTPGRVTVEGFCDDGTSRGSAGFTLGAGQARLVTAQTLESGHGLDASLALCPTGKSRLVVTGEFADMKVQNFLRNTTSAGLINANVNNED
ncbi:MAG: hypothetical protein ACREO4_15025 [Lysobacter sp.]